MSYPREREAIRQKASDIEDAIAAGKMSADQTFLEMWQLVDAGFNHQWERCRRLEALLVHALVHSAYHECGRSKMDSDERELFDDVIRRANDALDVEYPDTLEES